MCDKVGKMRSTGECTMEMGLAFQSEIQYLQKWEKELSELMIWRTGWDATASIFTGLKRCGKRLKRRALLLDGKREYLNSRMGVALAIEWFGLLINKDSLWPWERIVHVLVSLSKVFQSLRSVLRQAKTASSVVTVSACKLFSANIS